MWTREEVERTIDLAGKKASIDAGFRELILNNPNKAIKELTGSDIPEGYVIKVIENEPGIDQTYVLPNMQNGELSEFELDAVAGGKCKSFCGSECGVDCYKVSEKR